MNIGRRNISKSMLLILMVFFLLIGGTSSDAVSDGLATTESLKTLNMNSKHQNTHQEDYCTIDTSEGSNSIIRVHGKVSDENIKLLCVRITSCFKIGGKYENFMTVMSIPDENGKFGFQADVSPGNTRMPYLEYGRLIDASNPDGCAEVCPGSPYSPMKKMPAGIYRLKITGAATDEEADVRRGSDWWKGILGGDNGYIWRDALLKVGGNNSITCIKYPKIIRNNRIIRDKYESNSEQTKDYDGSYIRYKDPQMKDFDKEWLFKNHATGKAEPLTKAQSEYLKKVSDEVVGDAQSDVEKLKKIYAYAAGNFAYDYYAWNRGKNQYVNPYSNIYKLRNKIKSANSTKNGQVATVCDGYAAIVTALGRAQGIPVRMSIGRHLSRNGEIWQKMSRYEINRKTHWWAEAYIDGKWLIIDPNNGTLKGWRRTSFSDSGKWFDGQYISYAGFNPEPEMIASSYHRRTVLPGSLTSAFLSNELEVNRLKAFLTHKSYGIINGKRLNEKFDYDNRETWNAEGGRRLLTDGYGKTKEILWGKRKFAGNLDLRNFNKLKTVSLSSNNITNIYLRGATELKEIYLAANKIKEFDSYSCRKAGYINLKANPLKYARIKARRGYIVFRKSGRQGKFGLQYRRYTKKDIVRIMIPNIYGRYQYVGVYTSRGKLVSKKKDFIFRPRTSSYYVKFARKVRKIRKISKVRKVRRIRR